MGEKIVLSSGFWYNIFKALISVVGLNLGIFVWLFLINFAIFGLVEGMLEIIMMITLISSGSIIIVHFSPDKQPDKTVKSR